MKLGWAALTTVLALGAMMPHAAAAQQSSPSTPPPREQKGGFGLGQNYPNPFNPETRIPFSVGDPPACTDPARQYRVTLRIYNLLAQVVAVPVIQGSTATVAGMTPIENLELECGSYTAYWNGKYLNTSRDAASGVYLYRLEVDGRVTTVKKMFLGK
jgi:hypothetical protein